MSDRDELELGSESPEIDDDVEQADSDASVSLPMNVPAHAPSQEIALGFAALQSTRTESLGETRNHARHSARLVPIRVRSIATDDVFVPLAKDIVLSPGTELVGVIFRPVRGGDVVLPDQRNASPLHSLEFTPARISAFGLVRTSEGKLVLADVDGELSLPSADELVGVIAAPVGTHALDVYDPKTDEMYRIGYSFPNTIQPDWVQLALDRRESVLAERAAERREREAERRAELEAEQERERAAATPAKPIPTFETSDIEVVRRIRAQYNYQTIRIETSGTSESLRYHVEDFNNFGPSHAAAVADEREEFARNGIDADEAFAKRW
jgi:hypothetical protein